MADSKKELTFTIQEEDVKTRIDKFLAKNVNGYSRMFFKKLIEHGKVLVDGGKVTPHHKVAINQVVKVKLPSPISKEPKEENIPLKIVFENNDIAIIDKPAGMIVHPTNDGKHMEGSLVNALLHRFGKKGLSDLGGSLRPGIVHRLDKDTSGLIIIAKNNEIHKYLVKLFQERKVEKTYKALVLGHLHPDEGTIEAPITRGRRNFSKMYLAPEDEGKNAISTYKVVEHIDRDDYRFTLLDVRIITGRTHQIRVHFNAIEHPVVGDPIYGNRNVNEYAASILKLHRQFLHAAKLNFLLPSGEDVVVESELPDDLKNAILSLS
jgi:23S rRNA pseudouridine1911/1915/1917 synthase